MSASWELRRGQEIDPSLVVLDPLGGGSRYEVFAAWDRLLFCKVAVKVVRPDRLDSERSLSRVELEAAIAARLTHPNLVRFLRWNPALPRPYLVFEYIGAQTVADHLDEVGPVSVPETCLLGIRMLSALHYLHGVSVLHLDVKPSNLTMGDAPRSRVAAALSAAAAVGGCARGAPTARRGTRTSGLPAHGGRAP